MMLYREREFDYECQNGVVADICKDARKQRLERKDAYLEHWSKGNPAEQMMMERVGKAGAYLTAVTNRENDTVLSADEFRDNVRLIYNKFPLDLPQHCNGCGAKLTVEHALSCRVGGLVRIRHNVADELRALCKLAFSSGHVQSEPRTYSSVSRRVRVEAEAQDTARVVLNPINNPANTPTNTPKNPYAKLPTQQV